MFRVVSMKLRLNKLKKLKVPSAVLWAGGAFLFLALFASPSVNNALARFYNPGYDESVWSEGHKFRAKLRGEYLSPGTVIDISLVLSDESVVKATAEASPDGSFFLRNIGEFWPDDPSLEMHMEISSSVDTEPKKISFIYSKNMAAMQINGEGFASYDPITVSLSPGNAVSEELSSDWSGYFSTGVLSKFGFAGNQHETCVSFSGQEGVESEKICLGADAGSGGYYTAQCSNCTSMITGGEDDFGTKPGQWAKDFGRKLTQALDGMAEQFSNLMMEQIAAAGTFLDAKQQLEIQRWMAAEQAEAHRDYHPARQVCYYATFVQDFTGLSRVSDMNAEAINSYMFDREVGPAVEPSTNTAKGTAAPAGMEQDRYTRVKQLSSLYCHPDSNGKNGLDEMCSAVNASRVNHDINYSALESRKSLDLDFEDATSTADESDLLAMSKHLFSHDLMDRMDRQDVYDENVLKDREGMDNILDFRSIVAMRGPLRDSFAQVMAMKGMTDDSMAEGYIEEYLKNMGVDSEGIKEIIGTHPSEMSLLYVMMNVMYQNPHFYTELYESEANIERVRASMQAIANLGGRHDFEATLRREMVMSMRLETRLREIQTKVNAKIQAAIAKQ